MVIALYSKLLKVAQDYGEFISGEYVNIFSFTNDARITERSALPT